MLFNSYIFIFLFLPITLLGWYFINYLKKYELAKLYLAGMSLWFYAYFNISYLPIIVVSILVNYLLSFCISKFDYNKEKFKFNYKKIFMLLGLLINLGVLFYFKYYDFFLENLNVILQKDFNLRHIVLPLGISFFTFQQLSFVIDRCTGKAEHYSFINYLTFVTFFPQLIAGPIVLYKEMIPQFENQSNRCFNWDNFSDGIVLFVIGLSKKILLADVLALVVGYGFAQTFGLDTIATIFVILCYTFEIYFDFSGYCDMAMGIGKMFNIALPVNFNSPYKACNVKDLWNRWHITLSRFFITYVYIPLGGSRKGKVRTLINILIIFTLSGLWHGAAWTYVAWGAMQGLLVVWDNLYIVGIKGMDYKEPCKLYLPKWIGWLFTFLFFYLSLIFFRSESMLGAFQMFKNIFSFTNTGRIFDVASRLSIPEFYAIEEAIKVIVPMFSKYLYIVLLVLYNVMCFFIISRKNAMEIAKEKKYSVSFAICLSVLFVWCVVSLSQVSTFLYFNF